MKNRKSLIQALEAFIGYLEECEQIDLNTGYPEIRHKHSGVCFRGLCVGTAHAFGASVITLQEEFGLDNLFTEYFPKIRYEPKPVYRWKPGILDVRLEFCRKILNDLKNQG